MNHAVDAEGPASPQADPGPRRVREIRSHGTGRREEVPAEAHRLGAMARPERRPPDAMHDTIPPLRTIGLVGGSSSQATHEYYRRFNEGVRAALGGHEAAEVLIASMNFGVVERLLRAGDWDGIGGYVADKAVRLERAGADFLLLVSHTLHRVAHRVVEATGVPFVDMIEVTAATARSRGLSRMGLLGTACTMTDPFYRGRYAELGVEVVTPGREAVREVDRIIFEELCRGRALPDSRAYYRRVVEGLGRAGAEGVILGCTEITLLLGEGELGDIPVLDTTALHTTRAVELALEGVGLTSPWRTNLP